jgi:hypothetical protein
MKYAVEMGSGAVVYIPSIKDWLNHTKVDKGIHRHADSMEIA